ncbi:hypothetical protein D3C76_846990 [compost metagenome]
MTLRNAAAKRQAPDFDTENRAGFILHQATYFTLHLQAHALVQGAGLECGEQRVAGLPGTYRAMTARRRLGFGGIGRYCLVAGVVEKVLVTGVGSFHRWHAALKTGALVLQPGYLFATALTEVTQGLVAHGIAGFLAEVVEHRLRRILDTGRLLLRGAAPCVDHATTARGGTTAGETIQRQHIQPAAHRLDTGAGTGGAETDHHQIGLFIPLQPACIDHL